MRVWLPLQPQRQKYHWACGHKTKSTRRSVGMTMDDPDDCEDEDEDKDEDDQADDDEDEDVA